MTAKIAKALIIVLVLAAALLAANAMVGSSANTKSDQAGTCFQVQTCPQCCCLQCCCDEPCCLQTKDAAGCPAKQQKPCCASK